MCAGDPGERVVHLVGDRGHGSHPLRLADAPQANQDRLQVEVDALPQVPVVGQQPFVPRRRQPAAQEVDAGERVRPEHHQDGDEHAGAVDRLRPLGLHADEGEGKLEGEREEAHCLGDVETRTVGEVDAHFLADLVVLVPGRWERDGDEHEDVGDADEERRAGPACRRALKHVVLPSVSATTAQRPCWRTRRRWTSPSPSTSSTPSATTAATTWSSSSSR